MANRKSNVPRITIAELKRKIEFVGGGCVGRAETYQLHVVHSLHPTRVEN